MLSVVVLQKIQMRDLVYVVGVVCEFIKNEARYSKRNRDHGIGSEVFHFGVRNLQTAEVNCRPH